MSRRAAGILIVLVVIVYFVVSKYNSGPGDPILTAEEIAVAEVQRAHDSGLPTDALISRFRAELNVFITHDGLGTFRAIPCLASEHNIACLVASLKG